MICTSIQDRSLEEIWDILDSGKVEMAESAWTGVRSARTR